MERLGPFEPAPRLAAGVSGGPDSLALALLLDGWARAAGGAFTALIVDHGLRPESAAEAAATRTRLAGRGIAAEILAWSGPKPAHRRQETARTARLTLLEGWCLAAGVLHLALAHHQGDQAETVLQRLARGSGIDGLAAMAPARLTRAGRLLRPLLPLPKQRLEATCRAAGLDYLCDPSNGAMTAERGRQRLDAGLRDQLGLGDDALARTAERARAARTALDQAATDLLAVTASLGGPRQLLLEGRRLATAPPEIARRALAAALLFVRPAPYGPRPERLARALARLAAPEPGRAFTVAGCVLSPRRGRWLMRPERPADDVTAAAGAGTLGWDAAPLGWLLAAPPVGIMLTEEAPRPVGADFGKGPLT